MQIVVRSISVHDGSTLSKDHVYTPGTSVKLEISTTVNAAPVAASLSVSVTDESGIEMREERKRPPRLQAAVFLEHEVRGQSLN